MKQITPNRVAEIVFAFVMLVFGILHIKYGSAGMGVPSFMPGNPAIWVYLTGAGFLAAAIAIFINKSKALACYLLALMLFIFILTIHLMPAIKEHSFTQPLKDLAIAMAAIMIGNNASK